MSQEENEVFFARIYLHHIRNQIRHVFGNLKISILDAGCGQGRISIPLALDGHRVTAIDFTPAVIEKAKENAAKRNTEINFIVGDLENHLNNISSGKFDCIISTEVLYMVRYYERVIENLSSLLESGGLFILSLRPRLFYVMHRLMQGKTEEAYRILMSQERYLSGGALNCQSIEEIKDIFSKVGVRVLSLTGIGVLSGIEGDPQAIFALPSSLTEKERELLFEMELYVGGSYPENGRYILACGVKSN
ncbi:MAG: methyltransferase domain-containing protein [Syntrophales bacterium]|nr:methyltransferase domain-containing protein [Syntrophales bacterium]